MKILSFLAPFISKIKTANIFSFLSVKYFGKVLLLLKTWHIRVNYCWNYEPTNLLFRFFLYRLGHLNNRQTKIAETSKIHFFGKLTPKQMFGKSFKFFDRPTTKRWSFKFFEKLDGIILIANFSKHRKYQTFGLIELHNLSKVQLADKILKFWKSYVYDHRPVEHTTFEILTFYFFNFQTTFIKSFMKKLPGFKKVLWKYW